MLLGLWISPMQLFQEIIASPRRVQLNGNKIWHVPISVAYK